MMPKCYAVDVDETIEGFAGPVTLDSLQKLREAGHAVGICGNWGAFCAVHRDWPVRVSFLSVGLPKDVWLAHFRTYVPYYDEYVMVGNILGVSGASDDKGAAERAGWRFIRESDFAAGER
jgi:hypothetical protein